MMRIRATCNFLVGLSLVLGSVVPGLSQSSGQFGGQSRADAASRLIVLAVQQAISSLPPTSAQSAQFTYDVTRDTYLRSEEMGPFVLRAPETIGKGKVGLRAATSYFSLDETIDPIFYQVDPIAPVPGKDPSEKGFVKFGLETSTRVEVLNLAATLGVTDWLDTSINLPLVIVNARAAQLYTTRASSADKPLDQVRVDGDYTKDAVTDDLMLEPPVLVYRADSFQALGFDFNDGSHFGVGRIGLLAKAMAFQRDGWALGLSTELMMPSPSEAQFAGSNSAAVLPRIIARITPIAPLRLFLDAGYEYDFDEAELRRFVWSTGASLPFEPATFDVGVAGSQYARGLRWTSPTARGESTGQYNATHLTAMGDTRLGTTSIDMIFGVKLRITETIILGGSILVPITPDGVRPDAVGTIAVEADI